MNNEEKVRRFRKVVRIAFATVAVVVGILLILGSFRDVFGRLEAREFLNLFAQHHTIKIDTYACILPNRSALLS